MYSIIENALVGPCSHLAETFSKIFGMAPKPRKKPAATKDDGNEISTVEEFAGLYLGLCFQPTSLPYPAKGGRQSHLAISSKRWIQQMLDQHGTMRKLKKGMLAPGFLEIHQRRKRQTQLHGVCLIVSQSPGV